MKSKTIVTKLSLAMDDKIADDVATFLDVVARRKLNLEKSYVLLTIRDLITSEIVLEEALANLPRKKRNIAGSY